MKLIRKITLHFQEGTSDKVYEVDLCEVATDKFVVNFRYGRRGHRLRESSKTPRPVDRAEADRIFEQLVQSKTDKGYLEASEEPSVIQDPEFQVSDTSSDAGSPDPRVQAILNRLREGKNSRSKWKLSRAIWKAGEFKVLEAEPLLHGLVGKDPMTNYCIAWTLGRLGQQSSVNILKGLAQNTAAPHVSQIAAEAVRCCVNETEREQLIQQSIEFLPEPLGSFLKNGTERAFIETFESGIRSQYSANLINTLYYIDHPVCRAALLKTIEACPLKPPFFRPLRRLFKAAELRSDGQIFGALARIFEVTYHSFRTPSYTWRGYKSPTLGEDATQSYSNLTRNYLRRRIWRTLRQLGEAARPEFVPMAVGCLLAIQDDDANVRQTRYIWDWKARQSRQVLLDRFASYWAFNQLLFQNSPRYEPFANLTLFRVSEGSNYDTPHPGSREEAFPELWRQQPRGLLHLLTESRCERVHDFAARAIRDCQEFCHEIPVEAIVLLCASKYEITQTLALDLAKERYNPDSPDKELVLALANCDYELARNQARIWIESHRQDFFADTDFTVAILTSRHADTRTLGDQSLFAFPSDDTAQQVLIAKLIGFLNSADSEQSAIASDIGQLLLKSHFQRNISQLGADVICDLLQSELEEVQHFAASVVLSHQTLSSTPTEPVLRGMLEATFATTRAMGVKVISDLPDTTLAQNAQMLASLCCHPLEDIRNEVRPVIKRVADRHTGFAREVTSELIRRLLTPGAPEGVPSNTSRLLREDLANHLQHISADTVWNLLRSRSAPAQEVGGLLLPTHIDPSSISVAEMVRLSRLPVVSIRSAAWHLFRDQIPKVRFELGTAVGILDSPWEDSRLFGFQYFRDRQDEFEFTPNVLINICDSVREDVQQFGREMITRHFQSEDGPEYALKLSEHPSADLQLFVTNFLTEFVAGDSDRFRQVAPFMVSILSRVNQSRVAKDRVLEFLQAEISGNPEAVQTISQILERISATCAIGDRARTIEAMLELHDACPDIELPLGVKPVEVR